MEEVKEKYVCINCGSKVDEIYKRYSATVLKLQNCTHCNNVVDKYVEYDLVIILIDLVLLKKEAYRHLVFNTAFTNHWKLAILILLMEAYTEWTLSSNAKRVSTKEIVNFEQFQFKDIEFFKLCVKVLFKQICFIISVLMLTLFYNHFIIKSTKPCQNLLHIWKCVILSSFGVFLFLPSLIWDENPIEDFHMIVVCLYTTLSQLIAYTVICNCTKFSAIFVILVSHYCKEASIHVFDNIYNNYVNINEVILNVSI